MSAPIGISKRAKYRVSFLKKFKGLTADVVGGSLENAHVYTTWQEAAANARSWDHSNKSTTRVIRVRRSRALRAAGGLPHQCARCSGRSVSSLKINQRQPAIGEFFAIGWRAR